MRFLCIIFSTEFWTGVKLGLDIVQSIVITVATVIAGIWALKTFGFNERLRQLEGLNRAVLNLRDAFSTLRTWQILNTFMNSEASTNAALERLVISAQVELRETFRTSMRLDFFKKMDWETRLLTYMNFTPSNLSDDKEYEQMSKDFNEVSAAIVNEGHFGMPKWLRSITSKF